MEDAPPRRAPRSDAVANREAILRTAARVVRERGPAVPLTEVAAEAGVGIGTLYRHFPDRDALLAALGRRTREVLHDEARHAAALVDEGAAPLDALAAFVDAVVGRRDAVVAPVPAASEAEDALAAVVGRGIADATLRADATAADVVLAAALLAGPLAPSAAWTAVARRLREVFLDGLAR